MRRECDGGVCRWDIMQKEQAFVAACWAFKRRHRTTEPTAEEFGLMWPMAEALARQVQAEFERQVLKKVMEAA